MSARRFEGKVVLVTGASAGIGESTALAFAEQGARVVAVARRRERLDALATRSPGIVPIAADVADGPGMEMMAASVLADVGVPDVIVANAGIGLDALFAETSDASLRAVFEVNVFGVVRSVRPFLPGMIGRGSGRILFVSSVVGKRGIPYYAAYSGSKFALHGMSEALRVELHGTGVTVGVVCPSSTTTEFQDSLLHEGPRQRRVRIKRHAPEGVARAILKMARSRRREAVLSLEGRLMLWVDAVAPGLLDALLARVLSKRAR